MLAVDERLYGAPIPCGARRDLALESVTDPYNTVPKKEDTILQYSKTVPVLAVGHGNAGEVNQQLVGLCTLSRDTSRGFTRWNKGHIAFPDMSDT